MAKRECLFCGSSEKLTSSHVISKNLMRDLPGSTDSSRYFELSNDPSHIPVDRITDSDPRETKPNALCRTCNNVWMEKHESEVAKTLTDLAMGREVTLDSKTQESIALWATIACILRGSLVKHFHISEADRRHIRNLDEVPEGYVFWIVQGDDQRSWPTRFQWADDSNGNLGWVGWLWIGQAIFVVASPLWAVRMEMNLAGIGPYRRHLASMNSHIYWPIHPELELSYEDFWKVSSLGNS